MPESESFNSDQVFMRMALGQAQASARQGEVPVGAVLVRRVEGVHGAVVEPLALAHNQPFGLHDPTAHAEILALREAASKLGNYRLDDCELYVTLEPCAMCAQALLHARIKRVVYGAKEPKTGAAGSVLNLFAYPSLNHQTVLEGGVLEDECAELMRVFFQQRRQAQRQHAHPLRDDALRTPDAAFAPIWAAFPQWRAAQVERSDLHTLDGLRLHALDLGPRLLQAHLFLHGPDQWWPQGAAWAQTQLDAGHRVLMPDLPGHGQSDKPKKYTWHTLERHVSALWALLQAQGIEQVHVAVAPGQMQLARLLAREVPGRVLRFQPLRAGELDVMPDAWLQAPYPDNGHRAAAKAWIKFGWGEDHAGADQ